MLKKICSCGKVIPYNIRFCDKCSETQRKREQVKYYKERTKERDEKYNQFYKSKEWKRLRQVVVVRDHAICQDCLKNNIITQYNTVHHIIPIKIEWNKRLDINNLICLCESCHQKRHNAIEKGRGSR